MKKQLCSLIVALVIGHTSYAQLIKNDFMSGTNIGDPIESVTYDNKKSPIKANQWHVAAYPEKVDGDSPIAVAPLEYAGYIDSGKDNALELRMLSEHNGSRQTGYSLTNKRDYASGTYYLSFLINVSPAMWAGDKYARGFIMFNGTHTSDFKRVVCFVKKVDSGNFVLGLGEKDTDTETVAYSSKLYPLGKTHLVVMKCNIDNNQAELFVNPKIAKKEPRPDASIEITTPFYKEHGIRAITLRQRSAHSEKIGGIRFAKTWEAAVGLE